MIDFDEVPSATDPEEVRRIALIAARGGSDRPKRSPGGSAGDAGYLRGLNPPQREAVTTTEGPLIVLAGAGSGKTRMLTSRIAYLIDARDVPGHQVLAVTFTNKAAGEMRERVERGLEGGEAFGSPEIGTFHSICVRWLRREAGKTPFTQPFVIYDDADQLSLVKSVVAKLDIDDKAFSPKGFQHAINRLKCDAVEPKDLEPSPHDVFEKKLKAVYEQYQKDLFANSALDFGEIICMTYRLLRDDEVLRRKYQQRYRYVHVDEYQDTNRAQYLLLSMLAGPAHGGHGNICVVGDEDQSIYKWRGADIRNIMDFESEYPGARVVKLEENYRSTRAIITAAASVIRNNRERRDKTLWTQNAQGLPLVSARLPDERAEAEWVVGELKRQAEGDGRSFPEFAVFYRTHAQSRQFEDVLRREKIPYQIVGGLRFYDRKEIKDVIAYFRAILNPADSISLKRIVNVPARGIGKTTLDRIDLLQRRLEEGGAPESTFVAALRLAAKGEGEVTSGAARRLTQFVALLDRLDREKAKLKLTELYHLILDETGYVRDLRAEATDESLSRIENLEEFDTLLQEFEEDAGAETPVVELLPRFIEQATLDTEVQREGEPLPGAGSVKLMTLHSSKGLEFPVVFLVGMEEGLFPSVRPWEEESEKEIEEERRLCYVGMTRACQRLFLSHTLMRRLWGNVTYAEPARFLQEIPCDLVEVKDFARSQGEAQRTSSYEPGTTSAMSPTGAVGRRLRHPEHGPGVVVAEDGVADSRKVTIQFSSGDQRRFLLRFVEPYFV